MGFDLPEDKYLPVDGCWVWTGKRNGSIPLLKLEGSYKSVRRLLWHETKPSYRLANHMVVRPTCGTPLCVKPTHLKAEARTDMKAEFMKERANLKREYEKKR